MHKRSLTGLRDLIDLSLDEVRLENEAGLRERILVADFIEELSLGALIQAQTRGLAIDIPAVQPDVIIEGNRKTLAAAVLNLLQNAFKFTRVHGHLALTTRVTDDRVFIEVEDECGGLPPGIAEELFRPYEQRGSDRSGIGLGLTICLKAAKANGGELHVRNLAGKGCVFSLELPRTSAPATIPKSSGGTSA